MNEEIIKKAKEAKTAEDLLALARENNIELTEDQARELLDRLHPATGELADDELDNVTGGGCISGVHYMNSAGWLQQFFVSDTVMKHGQDPNQTDRGQTGQGHVVRL